MVSNSLSFQQCHIHCRVRSEPLCSQFMARGSRDTHTTSLIMRWCSTLPVASVYQLHYAGTPYNCMSVIITSINQLVLMRQQSQFAEYLVAVHTPQFWGPNTQTINQVKKINGPDRYQTGESWLQMHMISGVSTERLATHITESVSSLITFFLTTNLPFKRTKMSEILQLQYKLSKTISSINTVLKHLLFKLLLKICDHINPTSFE